MPQHPLIRLMLSHANGRDVEPHRPVPPAHLSDRRWRFVCECGLTFYHHSDAVRRDNEWVSPRRQCAFCLTWIDGHPVE
jgi:hypothetical protein